MYEPGDYNSDDLTRAVKLLSRCLDAAPLEVLERSHAELATHFVEITAGDCMETANEQRLMSVIWAEIEVAIDARREKQV